MTTAHAAAYRKGYQQGFAGILLMGTVPVAIKWVSADPWVIGVVRLFIATGTMMLLYPVAREFRGLKLRDWGMLLAIGLCFSLHWITYFFSIKLGSASIAVVATISFYGIFLSIAGNFFLGHRIRWFHILALIVGVIGTLLVAGSFPSDSNAFLGFLFGIVSGSFYGSLPILHQKAPQLSSTLRSWAQYAGGLLIFICFIPLGEWHLPVADWIGLVYLGLIGTVCAHTLWVHAVSILPTTASSMLKYLYIPSTVLLSHLILGERMSSQQILGACVIVLASIFDILGPRLIKNR